MAGTGGTSAYVLFTAAVSNLGLGVGSREELMV